MTSDDLLDTVSKALALHDEAHHRLVCECVLCDPNTQLRGWLRSLLARCREAETALADLRERDHVLSKHLEDRATARDPLAQSLIAAENAALERAKRAESDLAAARAEAETERMRLVACGVAAMQNTEAAATERIGRDNPCWSASYGDVCASVDREMAHRAEVERLREIVAHYGWCQECCDGPDCDDMVRMKAALDTPAREGGEK